MRKLAVFLLAGTLGACATTESLSDQQKLALYSGHAGAPVAKIRYRTPIGWEKVDDSHLLLQMRPTESWLLRLSGPCLEWTASVPTIVIDSRDQQLTAGFDTIRFNSINAPAAPMSCRIEEIRPVDLDAARAERDAVY